MIFLIFRDLVISGLSQKLMNFTILRLLQLKTSNNKLLLMTSLYEAQKFRPPFFARC